MYSGDPIRDHEEREDKAERWLSTLPICSECGEPIQDDECFEINGELVCPECLVEHHQRRTEDFTA
jgi:formylmethanofuran dehydrogenase subunit E